MPEIITSAAMKLVTKMFRCRLKYVQGHMLVSQFFKDNTGAKEFEGSLLYIDI